MYSILQPKRWIAKVKVPFQSCILVDGPSFGLRSSLEKMRGIESLRGAINRWQNQRKLWEQDQVLQPSWKNIRNIRLRKRWKRQLGDDLQRLLPSSDSLQPLPYHIKLPLHEKIQEKRGSNYELRWCWQQWRDIFHRILLFHDCDLTANQASLPWIWRAPG